MNLPDLPVLVDALTVADIAAAAAVEQAAYTDRFSRRDYRRELSHNKLARYLALRVMPPLAAQRSLVGMAGYWLIADEAHIITIATHPGWQRRGLGEWLLLHLLEDALNRGAAVATLEVRPSNRAAISLYHKYRFAETGRRHHYYPDTGEDALVLTTPPLNTADYRRRLADRRAALQESLARLKPTNTGHADEFI